MYLETIVLRVELYLSFPYALFLNVPNIVIDHVSSRVSAILLYLVSKSN